MDKNVVHVLLGLAFIAIAVLAKKETNRKLILDVTDIKEFKKVLRTRTNVLVAFSTNEKAAASWMGILSDTAYEMKGLATIVFVPCDNAKKMCKKLKVAPPPVMLKHYKDGEYNADYDRLKKVKSMVKFLKDPTGDVPWDEDPDAQDVLHVETTKAFNKLLNNEKKPILTMFYAPWCGHCKRMKPEFSQAATELKADAVLVGMDVDNPDAQGLRETYNITGFPTIVYFENGRRKYDYGGGRTKDGIIEWMADPQPAKEPEPEEEWSDVESEVVHLTDVTFDPYIAGNPSVLVMFYAPWCGHCKKMKPEYTEAAADLAAEGLKGVLAAVDATKSPELGQRFEVKGYPTVKYFKDGEFAWDLNERTGAKILEFMKDPQEPPPPPPPEPEWKDEETAVHHLTGENFKTFTKKKKHSLVMFYAPWCGHCKKAKPEYTAAAEELKDENKAAYAAVDCTAEGNDEVCKTFEVTGFPTLKYLNYGKDPEAYNLGREKKDFVKFMRKKIDPNWVDDSPPPPPADDFWLALDGGENVKQLGDDDFDAFTEDRQAVLVMFYAPWCGHCKMMKPAYSEAATKALEMKLDGVFAAMDATIHKEVPSLYDVKGFPTVKLFSFGVEVAEYNGDRSTDDLFNFVKDLGMPQDEEGADEEEEEGEPEPQWSDEPSAVNHLTDTDFAPFITAHKNVLAMFYAPWCGHCQHVKPYFTAAAEKFKIDAENHFAAVDCTVHEDTCEKYEVSGYPTFKLFQNGKLGAPYDGGRDEKSFVNFMSDLKPSASSRQTGDL